MALRELTQLRQESDRTGHKRWFEDDYFDLVVWYAEGDRPIAFHLTYGKPCTEHAVTWRQDTGFGHHAVDDGERTGGHKQTPLLVKDGAFPASVVIERFATAGASLPDSLAAFVLERLRAFPGPLA